MHDVVQVSQNLKDENRRLRRLRHKAKKRGFRIKKTWDGVSLVSARIEPPRAFEGLAHVTMAAVEAALDVPLRIRIRARGSQSKPQPAPAPDGAQFFELLQGSTANGGGAR
jgi:hypothetical protein